MTKSCRDDRSTLNRQNTTILNQAKPAPASLKPPAKLAPTQANPSPAPVKPTPEIYYQSAYALFIKKDYQNALKQANNAINLDPNYAKAYYIRGLCYRRKGKLKESLIDHEKAIQLKYRRSYYHRAEVYKSLGDYQRARKDINQFLKVYPNHGSAIVLRNEIRKKQKEQQTQVKSRPAKSDTVIKSQSNTTSTLLQKMKNQSKPVIAAPKKSLPIVKPKPMVTPQKQVSNTKPTLSKDHKKSVTVRKSNTNKLDELAMAKRQMSIMDGKIGVILKKIKKGKFKKAKKLIKQLKNEAKTYTNGMRELIPRMCEILEGNLKRQRYPSVNHSQHIRNASAKSHANQMRMRQQQLKVHQRERDKANLATQSLKQSSRSQKEFLQKRQETRAQLDQYWIKEHKRFLNSEKNRANLASTKKPTFSTAVTSLSVKTGRGTSSNPGFFNNSTTRSSNDSRNIKASQHIPIHMNKEPEKPTPQNDILNKIGQFAVEVVAKQGLKRVLTPAIGAGSAAIVAGATCILIGSTSPAK